MQIAILDDNPGQITLFEDLFLDMDIESFINYDDFKQKQKKYDVYILSHQFDGFPWKIIYDSLNSKSLFIITATFDICAYKNYPNLYKDLTDEIAKHENVLFSEKSKYEKIRSFIEDCKIDFENRLIVSNLTRKLQIL